MGPGPKDTDNKFMYIYIYYMVYTTQMNSAFRVFWLVN